MVLGRRLTNLVAALVLAVVPATSHAQSGPGGLLGVQATPSGIHGGMMDQQRATGVLGVTVLPPRKPGDPAPRPGNEHFLCWNIWYAHVSGNEWLLLTDAPTTPDGDVFITEAEKAITSAPAGAHWTVRRSANRNALRAAADAEAARMDGGSAAASATSTPPAGVPVTPSNTPVTPDHPAPTLPAAPPLGSPR